MPPGRLSITIGWPRRVLSSSANSRPITSTRPPAGVVMISRIGRAG
jgi:hypothetical protein